MLAEVLGEGLGEQQDNWLYGFLHIDPLEATYRNGTARACTNPKLQADIPAQFYVQVPRPTPARAIGWIHTEV